MSWHYGIRNKTISKKKKENEIEIDEEDLAGIVEEMMGGAENKFPFGNDKIRKEGNHIYFYSSVKTSSVLDLITHIKDCEKENLRLQLDKDLENPPKIYLHINSLGGTIFDAFSAIDCIIKCKVPVVSIIEGCAASAATMISIVANERIITPHSHMLIHQLSSGCWGKFSEIEEEYQNLKKLMKMIKELYKEYTDVKMKTLDETLKHDIWWDADECLEQGLVDKIE